MKFLEFISAVNLFEAAKDRYTQMFTNLVPLFKEAGEVGAAADEAEYVSTFNNEIDWAMRTLKKQDKVIWYLRLVKAEQLRELDLSAQHVAQETVNMSPDDSGTSSPQTIFYFKASKAYKKALGQLAGKMGASTEDAAQAAIDATNPRFKRKVEHFMSLGIAGIEEYVFSNQTPRQILSDWTPIEDVWKSKRKAHIPIDREGVDTLIEYPDGSEWVNLNKAYCDAEGNAMGHCGNGGSLSDDDTILSYRTIEEVDGEKMWKPNLTFILNRRTGLLGETKGRANQPPSAKYHNVIVDLLKHDFIKGIRGGGYMPENNFKLGDLPEETQDELIELKPGLASISYDYKRRGMTKQLLDRMESMWEETEVDFPEFSEKDNTFWHDTNSDLDGFLDSYGGDQATWVAKILDGRESLDIWFDGAYYQDELFDGLSNEAKLGVGKWVIENYEDQVEEWKEENDTDYDGTDADDTWKIINEYDIDEVTDALRNAEMRGHEYGAEKEMSDSLSSWLKDLPNEQEWELSLYPDTTWEEEDAGYRKLGTSVETMIDILDNHLNDLAYQGGVPELAGIKELVAPYDGWQGFDEEGAKEHAEEALYEAGVLSNETS